jgi:ribosome-binding protein aMBF1 (putative translation factor)
MKEYDKNGKKLVYTLEEAMEYWHPDPIEREEAKKDAAKGAAQIIKRFNMSTARKIKKARENANLTQAQLAKKLKTQPSAISRIESGEQNISTEYLIKVLEATGTPYKIDIKIY